MHVANNHTLEGAYTYLAHEARRWADGEECARWCADWSKHGRRVVAREHGFMPLMPKPADAAREASFAAFQRANAIRCGEAFNHGLDGWTLLEWAGAMCGEAGEVANVCKKIKRKQEGIGGEWAARDPDATTLLASLGDEIGDTLAYLSLLASAAGLDLWECAARKFDAISDKVGWPGVRLLAAQRPEVADGE